MALRKIWIVSASRCQVIYSRVFPGAEAEAIRRGFVPADAFNDRSVTDNVMKELCLNQYNDINSAGVDCRLISQLPVMRIDDKVNRHLWPVIIIQCKDAFILGLVLVKSAQSQQVLDEPEISSAMQTLKTFTEKCLGNSDSISESQLINIELYITERMSFGKAIV